MLPNFSNVYEKIKGFDEKIAEKFKKVIENTYSDKIVSAHKEWNCQICNKIIKKGEKYIRITVKLDCVFATKERCLECSDKLPKKKLKKFLFLSK
jgi:hypothetical protein